MHQRLRPRSEMPRLRYAFIWPRFRRLPPRRRTKTRPGRSTCMAACISPMPSCGTHRIASCCSCRVPMPMAVRSAPACGSPKTRALAPMNVYGASKAAADLALGSMALQGLRVVRLRTFNHTGPGQSAAFVVAAFARQIARIAAGLQPPSLLVGNLDTWRDFLDVRDVCRAYLACIAHRDDCRPARSSTWHRERRTASAMC